MRIKPQHSTLDLCARAALLLREAGFVLHNAAMKTESCYYRLPDRAVLLRVSDHQSKQPLFGFPKVVSKITFVGNCEDRPGEMRLSEGKLQQVVAQAIGMYLLKSKAGD